MINVYIIYRVSYIDVYLVMENLSVRKYMYIYGKMLGPNAKKSNLEGLWTFSTYLNHSSHPMVITLYSVEWR